MPTFRATRTATVLAGCCLALAACADLPAPDPQGADQGRRLLHASAVAHGSAGFAQLHDINVAYAGTWSSLIKRIQPALVDDRFRGGSDERLLLAPVATGQQHDGPAGSKHVARTPTEVQVWRNGVPDADPVSRAAAALVVDSYRLFLLGPLLLDASAAPVDYAGTVSIDDRDCDRLLVTLAPGFGFAPADRVELDVDQVTHRMRRVRFTVEGLATTRGAIAQVDVWDYVTLRGVAWPTHFRETLVRPIPGLPVHDWHLVGIDFDRGYTAADIGGAAFTGSAVGRAGSR